MVQSNLDPDFSLAKDLSDLKARLQRLELLGNTATVPPGGTTGQALTKSSGTDYATVWASVAASLAGLTDVALSSPTTGQALTYNSSTSKWNNFTLVPAGGSTGQALVKSSGADFATAWTQIADYQSPNYIINGGFDIWQRGTSITPPLGYGYTADRWHTYSYAASSATVTQQALTPGTISNFDGAYFLRVTATSNRVYLQQKIEDARKLAGQTATYSFWAKSASAQTVTSEMFQDLGTGGSGVVGPFGSGSFAVTTSWARYSATVSIPSVSGFTIGPNSSLQFNLYAAINNALDVTGFQLESGSVATPFRRNANSIQGELAACQRYYYRWNARSVYARKALGMTLNDSATAIFMVDLPVTMRSIPAPTLEHSGASTFQITRPGFASWTAQTIGFSTLTESQDAFWIFATGAGVTNGVSVFLEARNNSSAYFAVSAEL